MATNQLPVQKPGSINQGILNKIGHAISTGVNFMWNAASNQINRTITEFIDAEYNITFNKATQTSDVEIIMPTYGKIDIKLDNQAQKPINPNQIQYTHPKMQSSIPLYQNQQPHTPVQFTPSQNALLNQLQQAKYLLKTSQKNTEGTLEIITPVWGGLEFILEKQKSKPFKAKNLYYVDMHGNRTITIL